MYVTSVYRRKNTQVIIINHRNHASSQLLLVSGIMTAEGKGGGYIYRGFNELQSFELRTTKVLSAVRNQLKAVKHIFF